MNITCMMTVGLILGILDWVLHIIYLIATDWIQDSLKMA